MKQIPTGWNSERLFISDLKESEIFDIQSIVDTSKYVQKWDGRDHEPDYVRTCFEEGNLPPGEGWRTTEFRPFVRFRKTKI
jgi:hypothetical protein